MTTPHYLPEIDLATFAPLPADQKRKALENFKQGRPPYSYKPLRQSFPDLLNLETGLFGPPAPVSFECIAKTIRANSRFPKEAEANIGVAAALYDQGWRGRPQNFVAMGTTIGQRLTYWTPAVLAIDGRPVIPFFNPRRTPLPPHGCWVVFSMMHEQIRAVDPDYAEAAFCICQFSVRQNRRARRVLRDVRRRRCSLQFMNCSRWWRRPMPSGLRSGPGAWEETRRRGGGSGGGLGPRACENDYRFRLRATRASRPLPHSFPPARAPLPAGRACTVQLKFLAFQASSSGQG